MLTRLLHGLHKDNAVCKAERISSFSPNLPISNYCCAYNKSNTPITIQFYIPSTATSYHLSILETVAIQFHTHAPLKVMQRHPFNDRYSYSNQNTETTNYHQNRMTAKKPPKTDGNYSKLRTKSEDPFPTIHHPKKPRLIPKQIRPRILIVPQPKPISLLHRRDCGNPGYRVWRGVHICCRREGIK